MSCLIWTILIVMIIVAFLFLLESLAYLIGLLAIAFIAYLIGWIIGLAIRAIFT